MATKLSNQHLETAHFEHFAEYIPGIDKMCKKTIALLLEKGMIQVSTAFEHALANVNGNIEVISEDEADLSDGSDAKMVTVRTSSYGTAYSAPVSNIKGKTGWLRVEVYERKKNKFYYFKIPFHAYSDIPASSNIEIPFEMDGTPRRFNRCRVNWWDYQVDTWHDMAK